MQLVIPMSGQGIRFQQAGYKEPKPLVKVNGTPMIERLLESLPQNWTATFILAENHKNTTLPELLKKLRPTSQIIYLPQNSSGPWLALQHSLHYLNSAEPIFISYCDYGMKWDPKKFENYVKTTDCDSCILSYRGFHAHYLKPLNYAYSRVEDELVKEVREKGSFTENRENEFASCGAYYFKSKDDLALALNYQKELNLSVNNEFYTSLTIEALLRLKTDTQCRIFEIDEFYQWGTPQDLENFEYWENVFKIKNSTAPLFETTLCSQLMIPMAGLGSRLKNISPLPKPLVSIDDKELYQRAIESFPKAKNTVLITLNTIARQILNLREHKIIEIDQTPHGQAYTAEIGLSLLNDEDFIVTACDHEIVLSKEKWIQFIDNPQCDAAIFTINGYPGAERNPFAYSYVKSSATENEAYPLVSLVSLKKPLSENPLRESLLVGSFWFTNKNIFKVGIDKLRMSDSETNNELYLDEIFNVLIKQGYKVRSIPLDGFINWGDSDSYKEALYWKNIFSKRSLS